MSGSVQVDVVQPHKPRAVLGALGSATVVDAQDAVWAVKQATSAWRAPSFDDDAADPLRLTDLLAGPWREMLNAATMPGQSKTALQAEIDSACELIDLWRRILLRTGGGEDACPGPGRCSAS